jgi:pimeloyl-ACP methyl ester carboxylesterase
MTPLVLPDGRSLDLLVTGPDDGDLLVFVHGTPGCAEVPSAIAAAAAARGLRCASWSRPGYGGSTRRPGRVVADIAADAAAVLDHLGVSTAYAAGWSGGGPHVLSLGALIPERIRAIASIAGVGPYVESQGSLDFLAGMGEDNILEFGAALEGEAALRAFLEPLLPVFQVIEADQIIEGMSSLLPEVDRAYCTGELGEELAASFREALRVGADGWVDDDLAFVSPWGYDLDAIAVPVSLWQGSADLMVPFAHGRWLAAALPQARVHLVEGEGHLSIGVGHAQQIVDELVDLG